MKACKAAFPLFPSGTVSRAQVVLCDEGVIVTGGMSVQPEAVQTDGLFTIKHTAACGKPYMQLICNPLTGQAGVDVFVQQCQ